MADSVPMVVICGQVARASIGTDAFQEAPVPSIMGSVAKHIFLVTDPTRLEATVRTAFEIARTGRPGPVVVDVPKDVQNWEGVFHGGGMLPIPGYRRRMNELAHRTLDDLEAGKFKEAIPELEQAAAMDSPPFVAGFLGYAYAKSGDHAKAETIVTELNQMSSRRFVSPFCTAIVYLGLGDKERALEGLEKSYEARSQWMPLLKVDRIDDPLRSEPRFIELVKKVGLDK